MVRPVQGGKPFLLPGTRRKFDETSQLTALPGGATGFDFGEGRFTMPAPQPFDFQTGQFPAGSPNVSPVSAVPGAALFSPIAGGIGLGLAGLQYALNRPVEKAGREIHRATERETAAQQEEALQDLSAARSRALEEGEQLRESALADVLETQGPSSSFGGRFARGEAEGFKGQVERDLDRVIDRRLHAIELQRARTLRGFEYAKRIQGLQRKAEKARGLLSKITGFLGGGLLGL